MDRHEEYYAQTGGMVPGMRNITLCPNQGYGPRHEEYYAQTVGYGPTQEGYFAKVESHAKHAYLQCAHIFSDLFTL
jgi:hypothetical protein